MYIVCFLFARWWVYRVQELREHAEQSGVALDFISTHQYPSDHQVPRNIDGHSDTITQAAAMAKDKPLFLTEYAINNHDGVAAAAGILTYIPRLSGESMSRGSARC